MKQKNEQLFYENKKNWSFDEFDIKTENFTNWDMYKILNEITNKNSIVLDLGTGGGEKVLKEFPKHLKKIIATDFSEEMIKTATKNLEMSKRKNIEFYVMDNLNIEMPKNYFDVVVARNTITDPKQIYDVLKEDGYLLLHGVDKYDCHALKIVFGKGQGMKDITPISIRDYEAILDAGFRDVELIPIHEREYFKDKEMLYNFLLKVPIINDFSDKNQKLEEDKLDEFILKNKTSKGIVLFRRYYGIIARK